MHHLKPLNLWFSPGLCPLRLAGDLCLAASIPLLIYRLRRNGATGVSVETQILRLVMFVTRYLDLFVYGQVVSEYNTIMKIFLAVTSLHVVASLIFRHKAYSFTDLQDGIYLLGLPLLFAMLLAPLFTYAATLFESSWAFSQLLGIVADIPQIVLLLNSENCDWKMKTYLGLIAGYRMFYIPHWILRYLDWGAWDPVAVMAGVSEAAIFVVSFITILLSNHKRSRATLQSAEEGIRKIPADSSITTAARTKTFSPLKGLPVAVDVTESP